MQAATNRCPPAVYRERYSLSDFEITHVYGEGPNWTVCAAVCKWSSHPVVLQTYTEVGNLSGCMALALAAAHSLTNHPALLPLYAVFRDVGGGGGAAGAAAGAGAGAGAAGAGAAGGGSGAVAGVGAAATAAAGAGGGGGAEGGGGGGGAAGGRSDKVVMVYPGGPAQHPLDCTGGAPSSPSLSPLPHASASASSYPGCNPTSGGPSSSSCGGGPPVSERGVVRCLLQPLGELLSALGAQEGGLRPHYVCGLDVWLDSPEAPAPGQALFMVPLLCHRRARGGPEQLPPAALPYAAPSLRAHPALAAGERADGQEARVRRWLTWSAAALVHTALMGSPPPDKPPGRKARDRDRDRDRSSPARPAAACSAAPAVPQLPPLTSGNANATLHSSISFGGPFSPALGAAAAAAAAGVQPRSSNSVLQGLGGMQRMGSLQRTYPAHSAAPAASPNPTSISLSGEAASGGGAGGLTHGSLSGTSGGFGGLGLAGFAGLSGLVRQPQGASRRRRSSSSNGLVDPLPLWMSDEAGDWFRRALQAECGSRAPLEELMRHPWVVRHAVPRAMAAGQQFVLKRDSLACLPRELQPLLLDLVPLGVSRPEREECEHMMAEMAAAEAPSSGRPLLPWEVAEGPLQPHQQGGPEQLLHGAAAAAAAEQEWQEAEAAAAADNAGGGGRSSWPGGGGGGGGLGSSAGCEAAVVERYEVAEEQREDGTRVVEEVRVVAGKPDTALSRAARALQAAMARPRGAGESSSGGGAPPHSPVPPASQWVMAAPRGTTFDDFARQAQQRHHPAAAATATAAATAATPQRGERRSTIGSPPVPAPAPAPTPAPGLGPARPGAAAQQEGCGRGAAGRRSPPPPAAGVTASASGATTGAIPAAVERSKVAGAARHAAVAAAGDAAAGGGRSRSPAPRGLRAPASGHRAARASK